MVESVLYAIVKVLKSAKLTVTSQRLLHCIPVPRVQVARVPMPGKQINQDENRYKVTQESIEDWIQDQGYNVVSVWECEKPAKKQ